MCVCVCFARACVFVFVCVCLRCVFVGKFDHIIGSAEALPMLCARCAR